MTKSNWPDNKRTSYLLRNQMLVAIDILTVIYYADGPVVGSELQEQLGYSSTYVDIITAQLRQTGIISGARGPGGGYALLKSPKEITLKHIIDATLHEEDREGYPVYLANLLLNCAEKITLRTILRKGKEHGRE